MPWTPLPAAAQPQCAAESPPAGRHDDGTCGTLGGFPANPLEVATRDDAASHCQAGRFDLSPFLLLGLFAAADALGAASTSWLFGTGLQRRDLEAPTSACRRNWRRRSERALPALPADIGLETGRSQHIGNFGLAGWR